MKCNSGNLALLQKIKKNNNKKVFQTRLKSGKKLDNKDSERVPELTSEIMPGPLRDHRRLKHFPASVGLGRAFPIKNGDWEWLSACRGGTSTFWGPQVPTVKPRSPQLWQIQSVLGWDLFATGVVKEDLGTARDPALGWV